MATLNRQLPKNLFIVASVCILFLIPLFWKEVYWIHILILTGINVLLAVSLRALVRTGQISMGTAGFMLLGAYTSALLSTKLGMSFWLTMFLGGLVASFVAFVFGYPFLRAKGIYFAILTVMLAEVCRFTAWYWTDLTGGTSGLAGIPYPDPINLFGMTTLVFDNKIAIYYLMLVVVIVSLIILYRIERSWFGLMWSAINESDVLAQTVGINIMGHKMLIFCITSFFMGIAGALYAHYAGMLSPYGIPGSPFGFTASIYILIYVIIGGEGRFSGPIIGAILLTLIPEFARGLKEYMPLIFGGLLILFIFILPNGISGLITPITHWGNRAVKYLQMRYKRSD